MAELLTMDGRIIEVSPQSGEKFTQEELTHLLETKQIEFFDLPNGLTMAVDAESKGKPIHLVNRLATILLREIEKMGPFENVIGKAVVLEAGEI